MKYWCFYFVIAIVVVVLFFSDIVLGSLRIPISEVLRIIFGKASNTSLEYIIFNFRLPKAITAVFVGAGISLCGLQMQTLFKNPLTDTSILGISSGASLGVASFIMLSTIAPSIIPIYLISSYWGVVLSAIVGALTILCIISSIISWIEDIVSILIIGVMFAFITSSIVSIMQYFSDPEIIKNYIIWSFGSLSSTTWNQLYYMIPIVGLGILASFFLSKQLNSLLLGENYAKSVGVNIGRTRMIIILLTSVITGTLVAFTGPISFIGIAVPHYTRMLFKTTNHKVLIPGTILCGMFIMLLCDIITQLPGEGVILPINAITSIIGAPIVIFVVLQRRKSKKSIFN